MKINLLPQDERPLKPNAIRSGFVIAMVGLLILFMAAGLSVLETLKVQELEARHRSLERHIAFLRQQREQVVSLQAAVQELEQVEREYLGLVQDTGGLSSCLDTVTECVPQGVFLERIRVTSGKIRIEGYARELASVSFYVNALGQTNLLATIDGLEPHEPSGFMRFIIDVKEGV